MKRVDNLIESIKVIHRLDRISEREELYFRNYIFLKNLNSASTELGDAQTEWMPKEFYSTYEEAETDIDEYIIRHYNVARGHSYNNYLTPDATEKLISSH